MPASKVEHDELEMPRACRVEATFSASELLVTEVSNVKLHVASTWHLKKNWLLYAVASMSTTAQGRGIDSIFYALTSVCGIPDVRYVLASWSFNFNLPSPKHILILTHCH
ncbi:MAG TPA: hypothetical protein VIG25_12890 [Pyrinomonadaceae bacterium]|jgi:hypothetical protein